MILNYTPLIKELEIYKEDILLIAGSITESENIYEGIELLGIKRFITFEEYAKIYPMLWYDPVCSDEERFNLLKTLSTRLGITVTSEEFI